MSAESIFRCAGCLAEKKQTNHWWLLCVHPTVLTLRKWNCDEAMDIEKLSICGQACVQKKVSEFMGAK